MSFLPSIVIRKRQAQAWLIFLIPAIFISVGIIGIFYGLFLNSIVPGEGNLAIDFGIVFIIIGIVSLVIILWISIGSSSGSGGM